MKCELDDIFVNYEVYGEGRPIVLLHGYWTDLRAIKGPLEPLFTKRTGWKRYYPDLPGMGHTPGKP
jgi:pimeloyl-ACP methyl ester carboxylesterase